MPPADRPQEVADKHEYDWLWRHGQMKKMATKAQDKIGTFRSFKAKWCWVARQYRAGWRVNLSVGKLDCRPINYWFLTEADVQKVLPGGKIVFVHMR